jgi:uncharacterized protein YjiS (DUF1127 family)
MLNLKLLWARIQEYKRRQRCVKQTIKELKNLTDRELNDIGISRYDIPRIAGGCRNAKVA